MRFTCLKCNAIVDINVADTCDNDCGTIFCQCGQGYYLAGKTYYAAHNTKCGHF
jgi:hypothetical protein